MNREKDSSSITAAGIKVVTYLQEQQAHNKHEGPIYIAPEYIKALEDLLIDHQAQAVTIKSLSEKNTAKEGVEVQDNEFQGDIHLSCPNCLNPIINVIWLKGKYRPNYCHYCGQKLKW